MPDPGAPHEQYPGDSWVDEPLTDECERWAGDEWTHPSMQQMLGQARQHRQQRGPEPEQRRPGCPRAVLIIRPAMAGAHEQPRGYEPADGAAEMRAVDRQHLKLLALESSDPAGDLRGGPIPGDVERVFVCGQPRLPLAEAFEGAELDPCLGGLTAGRP